MALKTKAYQGWEKEGCKGGGARFPFQSCYETRPAGKQQCARHRFIIRFFEGPVVRERASSREPLPDLSTFAVRFFFIFFMPEGLSHWAKYRGSGPHPDKRGTASEPVMINAQDYI